MRVWDFPPKLLCRNHLLGEHAETHAIWSIITRQKRGFSHHPEVGRWRGKLRALYSRHEQQVKELEKRGYQHQSPLNINLARGKAKQKELIDSLKKQKGILKRKRCDCRIRDLKVE
jgi:hypothetical protein